MLLILSAFFHDIGMAADEKDVVAWQKSWDTSPVYESEDERLESAKFERYCAARPEEVSRIEAFLQQGNQSGADLSRNYSISDYIRTTHADRAREIAGEY